MKEITRKKNFNNTSTHVVLIYCPSQTQLIKKLELKTKQEREITVIFVAVLNEIVPMQQCRSKPLVQLDKKFEK